MPSLDPKQITNAIASADVVTIQSIKKEVNKPRTKTQVTKTITAFFVTVGR
jgi:hypothetical protein